MSQLLLSAQVPPSIIHYIPHRNSMVFVDKIFSIDKDNFIVQVEVTKKFPIKEESGVPSYCGIEMMAQAICAYNTCHYNINGEVKVGFMISIRNFKAMVDFFPYGSLLNIKVEPILIVDKTGSFLTEIYLKSKLVASCRVTAYVPSKIELLELRQN